jgi:lycopene cyclase domain-containing protein
MLGHFSYLAMLLFTLLGSGWLNFFYKMKLMSKLSSLAISILPPALIFFIWDEFAIARGNWFFDHKLITNIFLPSGLPIEELLFFLIVPLAAILTIEAVLATKQEWKL